MPFALEFKFLIFQKNVPVFNFGTIFILKNKRQLNLDENVKKPLFLVSITQKAENWILKTANLFSSIQYVESQRNLV